jgi:hypothetical protein
LKSSKTEPEEQENQTQAKQPEQSEQYEFTDYDMDFGDDFENPTDEGIKVSSSEIEPVSFSLKCILTLLE